MPAAAETDLRCQQRNPGRADGSWLHVGYVRKTNTYRGTLRIQQTLALPHRPLPGLAAADVDRVIYKVRGPDAETNGTLTPEIKAELDGLSLQEVIDRIKATGGKAFSTGSSTYRGVSWRKGVQKWEVRFRLSGKYLFKMFSSELQAAQQYDAWCKQYGRPLSYYNFPPAADEDTAAAGDANLAPAAAAPTAPAVLPAAGPAARRDSLTQHSVRMLTAAAGATAAPAPAPAATAPPAAAESPAKAPTAAEQLTQVGLPLLITEVAAAHTSSTPAAACNTDIVAGSSAAVAVAVAAAPVAEGDAPDRIGSDAVDCSSSWCQWLEGSEGGWWSEGGSDWGDEPDMDPPLPEQHASSPAAVTAAAGGVVSTQGVMCHQLPGRADHQGVCEAAAAAAAACCSCSAGVAGGVDANSSSVMHAAVCLQQPPALSIASAACLQPSSATLGHHQQQQQCSNEPTQLSGPTADQVCAAPKGAAIKTALGSSGSSGSSGGIMPAPTSQTVSTSGSLHTLMHPGVAAAAANAVADLAAVLDAPNTSQHLKHPATISSSMGSLAHSKSCSRSPYDTNALLPLIELPSNGQRLQPQTCDRPPAQLLSEAHGHTDTVLHIDSSSYALLQGSPLLPAAAIARAAAAVTQHPSAQQAAAAAVAAAGGTEPAAAAVEDIAAALRLAAAHEMKQLQPGGSHYWRGKTAWTHRQQHQQQQVAPGTTTALHPAPTTTSSSSSTAAAQAVIGAADADAAAAAAIAAASAAGQRCSAADLHAAWVMQRLASAPGGLRVVLLPSVVPGALLQQVLADERVEPLAGLHYEPVPGLHPDLTTPPTDTLHHDRSSPSNRQLTDSAAAPTARASTPAATAAMDPRPPSSTAASPACHGSKDGTNSSSSPAAGVLTTGPDFQPASTARDRPLPAQQPAAAISPAAAGTSSRCAADPDAAAFTPPTAAHPAAACTAPAAAAGADAPVIDWVAALAAAQAAADAAAYSFPLPSDFRAFNADSSDNDVDEQQQHWEAQWAAGLGTLLPAAAPAVAAAAGSTAAAASPGDNMFAAVASQLLQSTSDNGTCITATGSPAAAAAADSSSCAAASILTATAAARTGDRDGGEGAGAAAPGRAAGHVMCAAGVKRKCPWALLDHRVGKRPSRGLQLENIPPLAVAFTGNALADTIAACKAIAAEGDSDHIPSHIRSIRIARLAKQADPSFPLQQLMDTMGRPVEGNYCPVVLAAPPPHPDMPAAAAAAAGTGSSTNSSTTKARRPAAAAAAGVADPVNRRPPQALLLPGCSLSGSRAASRVATAAAVDAVMPPAAAGCTAAGHTELQASEHHAATAGGCSSPAAAAAAAVAERRAAAQRLRVAGASGLVALLRPDGAQGEAVRGRPPGRTQQQQQQQQVVGAGCAAAAADASGLMDTAMTDVDSTAAAAAVGTDLQKPAAAAATELPAASAAAAAAAASCSTAIHQPPNQQQQLSVPALAAATSAPVTAASGMDPLWLQASDSFLQDIPAALLTTAATAATAAAAAALQPQPMEVDWSHYEDLKGEVGLWPAAEQRVEAAYAAAVQAVKQRATELQQRAAATGEGCAAAEGQGAAERLGTEGQVLPAAPAAHGAGAAGRPARCEGVSGDGLVLSPSGPCTAGVAAAASALAAVGISAVGSGQAGPGAVGSSSNGSSDAAADKPDDAQQQQQQVVLTGFIKADSCPAINAAAAAAALGLKLPRPLAICHQYDPTAPASAAAAAAVAALVPGGGCSYGSSGDYPTVGSAADVTRVSYGAAESAQRVTVGQLQGQVLRLQQQQELDAAVEATMRSGGPAAAAAVLAAASDARTAEDPDAWVDDWSHVSPAMVYKRAGGRGVWAEVVAAAGSGCSKDPVVVAACELGACINQSTTAAAQAAAQQQQHDSDSSVAGWDLDAAVAAALPRGLPPAARDNAILAARALQRRELELIGCSFSADDHFNQYYGITAAPEDFWRDVLRGDVGRGQQGFSLPAPRVPLHLVMAAGCGPLTGEQRLWVMDREQRYQQEVAIVIEARRRQLAAMTGPGGHLAALAASSGINVRGLASMQVVAVAQRVMRRAGITAPTLT